MLGALALLWVAALGISIGTNLIMALAIVRLGGSLEFLLFLGPELWRTEVRPGVTLSVRAIPGGVILRPPLEAPPSAWRDLPRGPMLMVSLLPLALLALCGLVLLGPGRFMDSLLGAYGQLARGAWSPLAVGAPLVRGALGELERAGAGALVGVWCAKFLALNLIPLPNLIAGQALMVNLAPPSAPTAAEGSTWPARAQCLSSLLTLVFLSAWLVAIVAALR